MGKVLFRTVWKVLHPGNSLMPYLSLKLCSGVGLHLYIIFPWNRREGGRVQRLKEWHSHQFSSVQFSQSCLTLCDPTNHSTPGLPVHHQLLEFTPTHVHQVSDAIQPSHPLSYPSPPAPNPFQHQGLFQWVVIGHDKNWLKPNIHVVVIWLPV